MTGAPPYNASSPSQQHRYAVYSPPNKNRSYYQSNEQFQTHHPQTPPALPPPSSLARSPPFTHTPSPLPTTLPPLNGAPPRQDASSQYQAHPGPSTPQFPLPRPFLGSMMSSGAYGHPAPTHAHRPESHLLSPNHETDRHFDVRSRSVGFSSQSPVPREPRPASPPSKEVKPARTDPMSFASILSGPAEEPSPRRSSPPPKQFPPPAPPPSLGPPVTSKSPIVAPAPPYVRIDKHPTPPLPPPASQRTKLPKTAPAPLFPKLFVGKQSDAEKHHAQVDDDHRDDECRVSHQTYPNGVQTTMKPPSCIKPRRKLTEREMEVINKIMDDIDHAEKSDVEASGFEVEYQRYINRAQKRAFDADKEERIRRKRRRHEFLLQLGTSFEEQAAAGMDRFRMEHEPSVVAEVQAKEIQDEKERKKDMQRKRRRENTMRLEMQKKLEAERNANKAQDSAEKAKFLREAERAQRKIKTTKRALEGGIGPEELGDVTPLAPNLEGGTTGLFHIGKDSPSSRRKSGRSGTAARPKKSKEQKQAEKEAAETAFAAMERDEHLPIAPKEDSRMETLKREGKGARSKEATPILATAYETKGYNQIYEQIWRDIARKDIPKVYRIKATSLATRQENLRKTAQLASKQSRKWQERTNKSMKDTQARAKRTMREMMSFWKRNEREERDLRRMAEKQEIESAKKAEAEREANRQRRKLNFLISQTELYSHFIGRKIKTAEAESAGDTTVEASGEVLRPGKDTAHTVDLPDSVADINTKVTNFEDLDFDADDETALRQAAMANAQNAVQEAQQRARSFNADQSQMAAFDEGEMNFQNPTSFGDIEISQPDMLTAKLKEYQLKGLNWLVNLYEQGINGILADEMGLGKTIQSISVMAYLAEVHNIWGPFLVIAPASTLHNWQQEITKFVPDIKVLPYWGSAKDRKILRKFWDRKHITYSKESEFHVLVTSYQLVVLDAQYFQKVKWQYMILDEAQAIKSSQSSRWKSLLQFHCRNRLLLTGTPIQNNMQELWALLHFIMPTLFDSHDEFSEWFSKDIESHAQSNTKLNEDQLKRLHMILKPFMLRRVKKHVQQELGDKVEKDVFCDLTYRQRAYYQNLRNRVSIMDLLEKAAVGDETDSTTLMNLVMQFRKVCNHPDLFERAETKSPFSFAHFAETSSFVREGHFVDVGYSTRSLIDYELPRLIYSSEGRIEIPGPGNERAGFRGKYLAHIMNVWTPENIKQSIEEDGAFSFLRFVDTSIGEACSASHRGVFERAIHFRGKANRLSRLHAVYKDDEPLDAMLTHSMLNILQRNDHSAMNETTSEGYMHELMNISRTMFERQGLDVLEPCASPAASAPPISISCSGQEALRETRRTLFNVSVRHALLGTPTKRMEEEILAKKLDPVSFSLPPMLSPPIAVKRRYNHIEVPSMRRFVTDSGKLAKLDELLRELRPSGHRVLLYFQMTRMIDLMEEYLTYRNYKYCRLDGSTKLEDRRDTVADFQQRPDIFVFLLSTRAGGLGINLTAADTVIFYDSDWNPTIDSQAMDRAHRLGQTKQVTVYRLITRGTIEERIRKRALQKEEVQRVVISGGAAGGVDFNARARESRTKDIAMWLADDEQAEILEQREKEALDRGEAFGGKGGKRASQKRKRDVTLDDMYHEGEGNFDDISAKPSGAATPVSAVENVGTPMSGFAPKRGKRGTGKGSSKRAKTTKERLRMIDGDGGLETS